MYRNIHRNKLYLLHHSFCALNFTLPAPH